MEGPHSGGGALLPEDMWPPLFVTRGCDGSGRTRRPLAGGELPAPSDLEGVWKRGLCWCLGTFLPSSPCGFTRRKVLHSAPSLHSWPLALAWSERPESACQAGRGRGGRGRSSLERETRRLLTRCLHAFVDVSLAFKCSLPPDARSSSSFSRSSVDSRPLTAPPQPFKPRGCTVQGRPRLGCPSASQPPGGSHSWETGSFHDFTSILDTTGIINFSFNV